MVKMSSREQWFPGEQLSRVRLVGWSLEGPWLLDRPQGEREEGRRTTYAHLEYSSEDRRESWEPSAPLLSHTVCHVTFLNIGSGGVTKK